MVKELEDHRKQLENQKRSIQETAKEAQGALKALDLYTKKEFDDLRTSHSEYKEFIRTRLETINTKFDSFHTELLEKDRLGIDRTDGLAKRLRIITGEVDDQRKQLDGQIVLVRRIEAVETKAQDIWDMMDEVKKNSQAHANDQMLNEIKSVTNMVFAVKSAMNKQMEEFKVEVSQ